MIIVLMGVAGSGKTTIGERLSAVLQWPFYDADDFHSPENVTRMAAGVPLTDLERWPWLGRIRGKMREEIESGRDAVVACSALKEAYREFLLLAGPEVKLVFLTGAADLLAERMAGRTGHFMKDEMLASQLSTLEEPNACVTIDVSVSPEEIVDKIVRKLGALREREKS